MKKTNAVLLVACGALLGLVGCGPTTGGSESTVPGSTSSSSSSSSEAPVTVSTITNSLPSYLAQGSVINLDDYITVNHSDGTTSKDFEVTSNSEAVTLDGHSMTCSGIDDVRLTVTSGDVSIRVSFSILIQDNIDIIDWINDKELTTTNSSNFTIDIYSYSQTLGFYYGGTSVQKNETWAASFNKEDPGELYQGKANSFIVAYLADGNAYTGYYDTNDNVVFIPGNINSNYPYYYIAMPWEIDPLSFTTELDEETQEYIVAADASVSRSLLEICSFPMDRQGYTYSECVVVGVYDIDNDEEDELVLCPTFTDGVDTYIVGYMAVDEVGSTVNEDIQAAQVDESYVPEKPSVTEFGTVFATYDDVANSNYTTQVVLSACDENGAVVDVSTDSIQYLGADEGNSSVLIQHQFTTEGVLTTLGQKAVGDQNYSIVSQYGFFDRDGAVYSFYQDAEGTTVEVVEGVSTFSELDAVVQKSAAPVTTAAFEELNVTSKSTSGSTVMIASEVGNDYGDGQKTNSLFEQLFNAYDAFVWGSDPLGTYFTAPMDGWTGDTPVQALSLYSNYNYIAVDTSTNMVLVSVSMYLPFGELTNKYVDASYVISNIGTTTADFSGYTVAA